MEALRNYYTRYCRVKETQTFGGDVHQLVSFHIPASNRWFRRRVIDDVLEESGADIMIETMRSSGGIIQKEMRRFDAVLIFERKPYHSQHAASRTNG